MGPVWALEFLSSTLRVDVYPESRVQSPEHEHENENENKNKKAILNSEFFFFFAIFNFGLVLEFERGARVV
jgi:hypothetical protein